jgi:transcriptional regulator with XRE-family HTH domain
MSIRRLAELAQISNPYLSQLERGLSEPSVRVLNSLAQALDLSAEVLLDQAGLLRDIREHDEGARSGDVTSATTGAFGTEAAIRADDRLSADQKRALLAVYRSYVAEHGSETPPADHS